MKAAFIESTGPPEVVHYGDLPEPKPGPQELSIRVGAVAVNPIDTYIRSGTVAMRLPKPYIIGCDFAGMVTAVGSEVRRYKPGDRVWGSNQGLLGRQGTFAELIAVEEQWAYPAPAGVPDEALAAVALVGITAHLGLFRRGGLNSGETVFANGGTGGVGSMVVQMAKAVGARVITTAGSPEKAKLCENWGADRAINYKTEDVAVAVRQFTHEHGVDLWFETLRDPDLGRAVSLTAMRGRIVVIAGRQAQPILPLGQFYPRDLSLLGFAMFNAPPDEHERAATDINRWLSEKKLHPLIGLKLPLSEAAKSHRLQEEKTAGKSGTLTGKIVLVP